MIVLNAENVSKKEPILFLSNHQNALLDPLLIANSNTRFLYFLTRAGVFNNNAISKLLKSLNMLPVYRIRDGWNTITNNNAVFKACTELLNNDEAICVFPEGNHNLKRTVRPLSKGFTRIIFEAFDKFPDLNIKIIPVGLSYINAEMYGDSVSLIYGKPIDSKIFNLENRNEAVIKLKNQVFNELTKLTVHIPSENYNESLKKLETLNVDFLNPESVNKCIETNFKIYKVSPFEKLLIKNIFKNLLIVLLFLPYLIWKFFIQPKIKEKEFTATFRFTVAITLVPVFILLIMFFLSILFTIQIAFLYLSLVLLLQLLAVKI